MPYLTELPLMGLEKIGIIPKKWDHRKEREQNYEWELIRKFSSKNSIAVTGQMIETYSKPGDHVLDPMCGIGTMVVESIARKRQGYGLDIYPAQVETTLVNCKKTVLTNQNSGRYKVIWDPRGAEFIPDHFSNYSMDLVIFSPPYGVQNHHSGKTKKQRAFIERKKLYSCQRYSKEEENEEAIEHDVSRGCTALSRFYEKMAPITKATIDVLKTRGHVILILQDYIRKGKPIGLVQAFINMYLADERIQGVGYYTRELHPTHFKQMQHGRGNITVCVEHTIVFKKERI